MIEVSHDYFKENNEIYFVVDSRGEEYIMSPIEEGRDTYDSMAWILRENRIGNPQWDRRGISDGWKAYSLSLSAKEWLNEI